MTGLAVVALVSMVAFAVPAVGNDDGSGSSDSGFWVESVETDDSQTSPDQPAPGPAGKGHAAPAITLGDGACDAADVAAGEFLDATFCDAPDPEAAQPVLTLAMIRSAFAALRLPPSTLVVQPPDGLTLVNFDTNFFTRDTSPITRTVTLLGQRVTLEATPSSYRWEFGDGEARTTSEPGAPYPRLDVTHSYLRTGTYRPRLATTYTGRYRVAGAGWRTIPGTVTIEGAAQPLRAIEAVPKLVPYE